MLALKPWLVSSASDWLKERCKFSGPIIGQSEAKLMQSQMTFDTQLKIALIPMFTTLENFVWHFLLGYILCPSFWGLSELLVNNLPPRSYGQFSHLVTFHFLESMLREAGAKSG